MKLLPLLILSLLTAPGAFASVMLRFSAPQALASNWANGAGAGGSNLVWGIVVDRANNGFEFDTSSYMPLVDFGVQPGSSQSLFSSGGSFIDDVLVLGGTMNTMGIGLDGNLAGTNLIAFMTLNPIPGLDPFRSFAIVWFDRTIASGEAVYGEKFGAFTDPSFVVPIDGPTPGEFSAIFAGPDPLKQMTHSLVPEPSSALLGLLAMGGAMRRRRD